MNMERSQYEVVGGGEDDFIEDMFEEVVSSRGTIASTCVKPAKRIESILRRRVEAGSTEATAMYMVAAIDALSEEVKAIFSVEFARKKASENHSYARYEHLVLELGL